MLLSYFTVFPTLLLVPTVLTELNNKKFPDKFLFGVSSAAYQIEGGYDSRGQTVLDYHQSLNPSIIHASSDAKIACDSYHKYKEDLELLSYLGVNFYRFSIAWTRILPSGHCNQINPEGVQYYNNVIDGLVARNITPVVTMFHYDLPKPLQDLGGWTNPLLSDVFEDYAKILFQTFGDRVKNWITFNGNLWGCSNDGFPPRLNQSGVSEYWCLRSIMLAHAKAYRLYQREFKEEQKGLIGFVTDGGWFEAGSDRKEDEEAAERVREFQIGLMIHPFHYGDFSFVVKERVAMMSREGKFLRSRIPEFSQEERKMLKGSYDFLGFNMYTTYLIENDPANHEEVSFDKDKGAFLYQDPEWEGSASEWLKVVPSGMRKALNWIKQKFDNPPILVTENGFSDKGELNDLGRIKYLELYLKSLLEAIHEDGVHVTGYAVWSLLDNFEWLQGYSERFGLIHVDFNDPNRPRTLKSSAKWYKSLIERRQFDDTTQTSKTEL